VPGLALYLNSLNSVPWLDSLDLYGNRNQSWIDWWTVVHVLAGVGAGTAGASLKWTLVAGTLYELVEPFFDWEVFGQGFARSEYPAESNPNRIVDIGALVVGWFVGSLIHQGGLKGWIRSVSD